MKPKKVLKAIKKIKKYCESNKWCFACPLRDEPINGTHQCKIGKPMNFDMEHIEKAFKESKERD